MKKVLIYFGSKGYESARIRLRDSAIDYFDEIISYGEEDIDRQFYIPNIDIFQCRRGWGYWLWKPYLIYKTLQNLEEGDLCFYVDATSVFVSSPGPLFEKCLKVNGILLFDNMGFKNNAWTKMDCFNLMGLTDEKYLYGYQVSGGFQLYQKNERSLAFVEELLMYSQNYHIISDDANITGSNLPGFIDHRHDQSILSLLSIKHNISITKTPWQYGNSRKDQIFDLKRDVKFRF